VGSSIGCAGGGGGAMRPVPGVPWCSFGCWVGVRFVGWYVMYVFCLWGCVGLGWMGRGCGCGWVLGVSSSGVILSGLNEDDDNGVSEYFR